MEQAMTVKELLKDMTVGELLQKCHSTVNYEVERKVDHVILGQGQITRAETLWESYAGADRKRYAKETIDYIYVYDNTLVIRIDGCNTRYYTESKPEQHKS